MNARGRSSPLRPLRSRIGSRWASGLRSRQPHVQAAVLPYYYDIFRNAQIVSPCRIIFVLYTLQVSRRREQIYELQENKSPGEPPTRTPPEHSKDVRIARFGVRCTIPYPRQYLHSCAGCLRRGIARSASRTRGSAQRSPCPPGLSPRVPRRRPGARKSRANVAMRRTVSQYVFGSVLWDMLTGVASFAAGSLCDIGDTGEDDEWKRTSLK